MRIGDIANSGEYQMDEQNQNLPIFEIKLWFFKLKKIRKFYNFENHHISIIDNSKKIIKVLKLLNFKN